MEKPSEETLFKDRNSKFFGYAFPIATETDVSLRLDLLKKKHHSARHFCYAWQLGTAAIKYRVNDDGEPNHTAGMPIYGQIQSFQLTNILVVSVRYFGGIKLGAGGLVNAYRNSARLAIEASLIIKKTIDLSFELHFEYDMMGKVMKIIRKHQLKISAQELARTCKIYIKVRKSDAAKILGVFECMYPLTIRQLEV